ncbi:protoporphyrinogen oxidase HemJ [Pararhizobium sp.]|uniref:protoporphyrinogen oxidase HemJ n=1 Tax=Pararhizobium sp. TaxID=1977563 RepID=UPI0027163A05|nr:protoporphyrinogen oxidase HemJ [Pararhizobium sp.]MDO9416796.1 protoporphyrinogen oxidase HemJ [Pararhizobium sp.]
MAEKSTETLSGRRVAFRAGAAIVGFAGLLAGLLLLQPDDLYLWIKAFHIIAVMSWMAGLLYLPRLFIYHVDAAAGSDQSETFKVMEKRLLRIIMNPAMIIAWVLGLYLAWTIYGFHGTWLHMKIGAVVLLSAYHMRLAAGVRAFSEGRNLKSARYWRLMNEVPTLLMIAIVILVVVKPFS